MWASNSPVNDMRNTFIEDNVWQDNLGIVDKDRSISFNTDYQLSTLKWSDAGVGELRREKYVVLDNVILQDILNCTEVCTSENRSNGFESFVLRNEDRSIGDRTFGRAGDFDAWKQLETGSNKSSVEGSIAISSSEKSERCTKRESTVDFVNDDTFANFDILWVSVLSTKRRRTNCLSYCRNCEFSWKDNNIVSISDKTIVLTSSNCRERLSDILFFWHEKTLHKCWNFADLRSWIVALENMVTEEGCDRYSISFLDGLRFRNIKLQELFKCTIGWSDNSDVWCCW